MKKLLLVSTLLGIGAASALAGLPQRTLGGAMAMPAKRQPAAAQQYVFNRPAVAAPATSETEAERPADAIDVPFKHALTKGDASCNLYTVVDANNDGKTWKLGGLSTGSVCMTALSGAADDWLLSPPVYLEGGKTYRVTIDGASGTTTGKVERIEIKYGAAKTVEAMTETAFGNLTFGGKTTLTTYDNDFTPAASGYYYFGIHCTSVQGEGSNTKIANFGVSEATPRIDPPAAGTLSYVLAPKGELKASVTYTAPTKGQGGSDLERITKIVVKTNWVETNVLDSIKPGQTVTFDVPLNNGAYNRIEAIAYVDDKAGASALIKDFFAGMDNPLPVKNLKITLGDDYRTVSLSWDPVGEVGEKGGYVATDKVTYYIFDAFGSYYDPAIATTTSTTITLPPYSESGQDFVAYQVTAGVDETYYSTAVSTDIVTVGAPAQMPFHESFSNGYYSQIWAVDPVSGSDVYNGIVKDNELQTNTDNPDAEPVYLNSHDSDNGYFLFMPMAANAHYGFFSAKIDISKAANPVLEFFAQGKGSQLDALVAADGGAFQVAKSIDFKAAPTDNWTLYRVDLAPYRNSKYVQVEFSLLAKDNTSTEMWSVPLDNVRVIDLADNDVRLAALKAPAEIAAGTDGTVQVVAENIGRNELTNVRVSLAKGENAAMEQTIATLAPGAVVSVPFQVTATATDDDVIDIFASVDTNGDASTANNSADVSVPVKHSTLPQVTEIGATAIENGTKVHLTWTAPKFDHLTKPRAMTEDFESQDYLPFTRSNFGEWTMYDGDGRKTYTFLKDEYNPYRTMPMAYQLYTPSMAGMPDDYLADMPTHSGNTLLVAFSANGQNDNWLISPALSGAAQTVKFFARSFTSAYPETLEVLYSTTDKAVESFKALETVAGINADGTVPEDWTELSAALPAGARYFAVRHNAYDTYALCLDDFSFEAGGVCPSDLELQGYKVYRNHSCVSADANLTHQSAEFFDAPQTVGKHIYHVTPVYNHGEARAAAGQEVQITSSVDSVSGNDVRVSVQGRAIVIEGAAGIVTDLNGRMLATGVSRLSVTPGIYLVKAADTVARVNVK